MISALFVKEPVRLQDFGIAAGVLTHHLTARR